LRSRALPRTKWVLIIVARVFFQVIGRTFVCPVFEREPRLLHTNDGR
jgi:hypothetical protein